jgi:hypothetical protein
VRGYLYTFDEIYEVSAIGEETLNVHQQQTMRFVLLPFNIFDQAMVDEWYLQVGVPSQ